MGNTKSLSLLFLFAAPLLVVESVSFLSSKISGSFVTFGCLSFDFLSPPLL